MSLQSGNAPRRLLQTHGAFINCVLANRLKNRRQWSTGAPLERQAVPEGTVVTGPQANANKRLNSMMNFVSSDECFDAREGEVLVYSKDESGFPNHRRACVFSSLNGYKVDGVTLGEQQAPATTTDANYKKRLLKTDPQNALLNSDIRWIGLCQNG